LEKGSPDAKLVKDTPELQGFETPRAIPAESVILPQEGEPVSLPEVIPGEAAFESTMLLKPSAASAQVEDNYRALRKVVRNYIFRRNLRR